MRNAIILSVFYAIIIAGCSTPIPPMRPQNTYENLSCTDLYSEKATIKKYQTNSEDSSSVANMGMAFAAMGALAGTATHDSAYSSAMQNQFGSIAQNKEHEINVAKQYEERSKLVDDLIELKECKS